MADTEEYFPRGGKKPSVQYFQQSGNFLAAAEQGERKKKKQKKRTEGDDGYLSDEAFKDVEISYRNCATGISYQTAKPGLVILGRVRQVVETKLHVMMPNKMMGYVMACHISEPYNKLLEAYVNDQTEDIREMSAMFRPGQYVALRVLEATEKTLMMSMMPQHVNGTLSAKDLQNGCVLQAAVSSVEDHGFVMDIGVAGVTAFMPKKSANPEIELSVGQVTWCCVKATGAAVALSGRLEDLQGALRRKGGAGGLLPATGVDFTVDNPLDNGIEGHIFKDTTAYVQRNHADTVRGKKPTLGQKVRARVLYVMPTRLTPFLTMRNIFETTYPDLEAEQKFKEGDIVDNAQVLKITGRCIFFKLGPGSMGSLSLRRVQVHEDLTDEDVVAHSYPLGSTHKVRVLCYNLCDYNYSLSDQPSVINEKYFNLEQFRAGDIVTGDVKAVTDLSVTVSLGRFTGYVPHAHLSDGGIFIDPKKASTSKLPKKKYKVGQTVTARVLAVDRPKCNIILTLKPSLLAPDLEVLRSYDQAEVGKAYTGVIRHIRDFLLVAFFDNVLAFVPRHYVSREPELDLAQAFHIGQIVNCTILKVDPEARKMTGSLVTAPFTPSEKREKSHKRKHDSDSVRTKKHTSDDENQTEEAAKRKKKKASESENEIDEIKVKKSKKDKKHEQTDVPEEVIEKIERKKGKERTYSEEQTETEDTVEPKRKKDKKQEVSEESDAIETDIQEDSDDVLTIQDLELLDLTDCVTAKKCKRKVVSLLKAMNARSRQINALEKSILDLEERGLNIHTKKQHTTYQFKKFATEERLKKLLDTLNRAQEMLKEYGEEIGNKDYKKKKEKKKAESIDNEETQPEEETQTAPTIDNKDTKKKIKRKKRDVKVVENLEPVLDVPSAKEFWSASAVKTTNDVEQEDDSSSSEDEDVEQPKKKRKKLTPAEKVAKAREEEQRVRTMERRAIESESQPRSSDQFERALLANPDCSQLWIAYMAFHLQATEIEKARAVGRKALTTISFREERERLNVWLALLNCEHRFGTKESQQKTLEEALQKNDTFQVHTKLLDILVDTGKHQELTALADLMLRKYKRDPQTYMLAGDAYYKVKLVDKARSVMQKAIAVLEKKEHVSILVHFALLERASGALDRAEALFEQVLAVYPQRVDVCAVYADMLVKEGDAERVRQVMERMTSQKLPARKMKILYKKWIEVEEKIGDQTQVETIRKRAMDYIEKAKF